MGEALITRRGGGGGDVLMTEQPLVFSYFNESVNLSSSISASNPTYTLRHFLHTDNSNTMKSDRLQPIDGVVQLEASISIGYKTVATGVGWSTASGLVCPFKFGEEIVTERKGYDSSGGFVHVRATSSVEQSGSGWVVSIVVERMSDTTSTSSIMFGGDAKYAACTAIGLL